MYSNVQSLKMYREGENYIWFINPTNWWDMVEIIHAISHKMSGRCVRLNGLIWTGFNLRPDSDRF